MRLVGKENGQHIGIDEFGRRVHLTEEQYQEIRKKIKPAPLWSGETIPIVTPQTDEPDAPEAKPKAKRGK